MRGTPPLVLASGLSPRSAEASAPEEGIFLRNSWNCGSGVRGPQQREGASAAGCRAPACPRPPAHLALRVYARQAHEAGGLVKVLDILRV